MQLLRYLALVLLIPFEILAQIPNIGVALGHEQAGEAARAGYAGIVENLSKHMHPYTVPEQAFQAYAQKVKSLPCPIYAYNIFLPGDMKIVGPKVDEAKVLDYCDKIFARLSQTDTRLIIWGSGGARRVPEGWDKKVATKQFIKIAKKIAALAQKYDIMLSLESLNSTETNFINTVAEALYIVKKVGHPNLRLNVDIYHMTMEKEGPAIIKKTKKYINHVEIAEANGRTAPGVQQVDFRPYFAELLKIKYQNMIVIEAKWANFSDVSDMSIKYLHTQINMVGYGNNQ